MNIYYITTSGWFVEDDCEAIIVCAKSSKHAKKIAMEECCNFNDESKLHCEYIGKAGKAVKEGELLTSHIGR